MPSFSVDCRLRSHAVAGIFRMRGSTSLKTVPYVRLSAFYFFWFATLGAVLPYWGLYLLELGFQKFQIGVIFATMMGAKMVAPVLWGWIADHYGGRLLIIRAASAGSIAAFLVMMQTTSFWPMFAATLIYAFFWNASLPQFEAVTLNRLGEAEHQYGRIRLWGSVGFIASVLGLAPIVQHLGVPHVLLWILVCLIGILAVSLTVDSHGEQISEAPEAGAGFWSVLRRTEVWSLLLVCFLAQLSHGPYYTFFSIYLKDAGYPEEWIGMLWALGVAAEIAVFVALPRLMQRLGAYRLMSLALAVTAVRWLLLAKFVDSIWMLILIQLMHLATFGIYHAVAVSLIHGLFQGRLQGRGQALYSAISFGAGGAAGALLSGWLWESWGAAPVFAAAGGVAILAWLVALRGLRRQA